MRKTGVFRVLAKAPNTAVIVGAFGALAVTLWLYARFGSDIL